jgi:tetratricopeptide (TPR) repeat protein
VRPGGAFPQAMGEWQQLLQQDPGQAANQARAALAADPGNAFAYLVLGTVEEKAGHIPEARRHYEHALQLDRNLALAQAGLGRIQELLGKNSAASHLVDAKLSLKYGEYLAAEAKAREVLRYSPDDPAAHAVLAMSLLGRDKKREASEVLKRIPPTGEQVSLVHSAWGWYFLVDGQHKKSEQAYQRAIQLDPTDMSARGNLGVVYYTQKMYDAAAGAFAEALKLGQSPSPGGANAGRKYVYEATLHFNLGNIQYQLAAELVNSKRVRDPKQLVPYFQQAEGAYQQAIRLYPANAAFYAHLSAAYLGLGRIPDAVQSAKRSWDMGLRDHDIHAAIKQVTKR